MKRKISLVILSLIMLSFSFRTSDAKRLGNGWGIEIVPGMKISYDSNIFKYSSDRIDEFVDGVEPERFEAIETYDDLILEQSSKLYISKRYNKNSRTRIRLNFEQNSYSRNKQKDFFSFSVFVRQYIQRGHLQAGYFLIPSYHIRHIYDEDTDEFHPCDFKKQVYSFKLYYPLFWKIYASAYYKFQNDDYNEYFQEYDSDINIYEINLSKRLSRNWSIELKYRFEDAEAQAYDEPGETAEDSDDSDISYDENIYGGEIEWDAEDQLGLPLEFSLDFEYHDRSYTTDKTSDNYHAGRNDKIYEVEFSTAWELSRRWDILLTYNFDNRNVSSDYKEYIQDVKDYTQNIISISAIFNY